MSTSDVAPHSALPNSPLAKERRGIELCVHCGFCLQSCPTFLTLEDENDSPRGRILLMKSMLEGSLAPNDESIEVHIAQCLGCRACETVCPSGVPYGHLLEATRATLAEVRPIPLVARLILRVFEQPWLLRLAMAGGRVLRATGLTAALSRLPGRMGFSMAMLHSTRRPSPAPTSRAPASNGSRGTVALLTGCVMEGLFAGVNRATERVLLANDYSIRTAPGQQCCGALHAHAGDAEAARRLARANIAAFEQAGVDTICVNAAGCGAMMKEYPHLLADDREWRERATVIASKVRDVSELLSAAGPARGGPLARRVSYDAPCHLVHAQRISVPPLDVLRAIPELDLVPLAESDVCCGSAGIYNLVEPDTSNVVLQRKVAHIGAANPDAVATGNPGCMMQIGAGLGRAGSRTRVVHPIELLDESYSRRQ
jgi:glycolate oxidase iron-sulfur subunit